MLHRVCSYVLTSAVLLGGSTALAAGYEKSIPFGGQSAGLAGIASPYIQGPQALFFNPAGLVGDKMGHGVSFDLTLLSTQFKGPASSNNVQDESERQLLTPGALMYGFQPSDRWGFGVGFYVAGGAQASYDGVSFAGPASATDLEVGTDLKIYELSLGAGYKINDDLKVGVGYRISRVVGGFKVAQRLAATNVANLEVSDLEGDQFQGFKVGAQYKLGENTILGLVYRSQVDFEAEGKSSGTLYTAGGSTSLAEQDVTAKSTFPQSLGLSAQQSLSENWNVLGEVNWTQYSRVEHVTLDGANPLAPTSDLADLEQQWRDQYNVRVAAEHRGFLMPIRFGYMWTSQVTHDDWARASFFPPANAHTLTAGSGYTMGDAFRVDGALEYTWAEGDGNGNALTGIYAGKYEVEAYGIHLGVSYLF